MPEEQQDKKPVTKLVIEDYLPEEFILCGLSKKTAYSLGLNLSRHLTLMFLGGSVIISQKLIHNRRRDRQQVDLFE